MSARAIVRVAAGLTLAVFLMLPAIASPEVTALDDGRRIVVVRPAGGAPRGVVLLLPGGTTTLALGPDGETKNGNVLIRSRALWLDAGFAIAYLNDPGDLRAPVALLRNVARPIVAIGNSRGTIVAAQNAARLGTDGPDMLVLTSPVTSGTGTPAELSHVAARSLADVDLRPVKIPTLVVTNDGDTCKVSLPGGAAALAKRIGANATLIHVASVEIVGPACEAFSPHGFYGIENETIAKIAEWIRAGTSPVTGAP